MKQMAFALVLFAVSLVSARADLTITQKVEGVSGVGEMTIKIKGDKARIDATPQITTIIDNKTGEMSTLMNEKKQVLHISSDKAKAMADMARKFGGAEKGANKPKLVATGRKEVINGYEAKEYKVDGGMFAATYWISTKYPNGAAILKELQKLKPSTWDITKKGMPDYSDFPGLPVRMTVSVPGQGDVTNTITSIKQDIIPNDQFAIPKDFSEMQMPGYKMQQSNQAPSGNSNIDVLAQPENDQYESVSGALNVGTQLYDKQTHEPFGIVKDIDWGKVQILTVRSARVEDGKFSAAAEWYPRSEITSKYVTKIKR